MCQNCYPPYLQMKPSSGVHYLLNHYATNCWEQIHWEAHLRSQNPRLIFIIKPSVAPNHTADSYHDVSQSNFYLLFQQGREETNIHVKKNTNFLPLARPQPGTWPTIYARALTGNQTVNCMVCRMLLNPIEPHQSELVPNIFEGCVDIFEKHASNTSYSVP